MNNQFEGIPFRLGESPFLKRMASYYWNAPSAVLVRTAEAELLKTIPIESPALDLCCGDGFFGSSIRPTGFEAGCDISESALSKAAKLNFYETLALADVSRGIPFPNTYFRTIVSNSSLEHIDKIDNSLREIARILKPGGKLFTTFASQLAYQWWPCNQYALNRYLNFQPVFNYFSLNEWSQRIKSAGMKIVDHKYYLSKSDTRLLMFMDYHLSRVYLSSDKTFARIIIRGMSKLPTKFLSRLWINVFSNIYIIPENEGGGMLIVAERV